MASQKRNGYPSLAQWIARDPDYEGFIFRRFDRLSARNLLHLQSRLLELEGALKGLDAESMDTSLKRWDILVANSEEPNTNQRDTQIQRDKKRMALYVELTEIMAKYQDALIRQSQVAALARPRPHAFKAFFDFFTGGPATHRPNIISGGPTAAGGGYPAAGNAIGSTGAGSSLAGPTPPSDVLALALGNYHSPLLQGHGLDIVSFPGDMLSVSPPPARDLLSRFLRNHWPVRGQAGAGDEEASASASDDDATAHVLEHHIAATVGGISAAVAMFLLIGAIVSLYVVTDPNKRLVMISCYTVSFAASVALMTSARRVDVFAATAAYAAVLVVFVSGDLGGGAGSSD